MGDTDENTRLRNRYHMNLSDSVGVFGEASSKIMNTSLIGAIKIEKNI
jgi:hypothetical protein